MGAPGERITIRRASPGDADAVQAVLHDTFASTWLPQLTEAAVQAFRREERPARYFQERGALFWVAERAGEVVGFVDWDGDFVNALHVATAHARSGVGSQLIDFAEREIAADGFDQARLETDTFNTRSRRFYARRGFAEVDRYPDVEWNSGLTTLLLVKTLR